MELHNFLLKNGWIFESKTDGLDPFDIHHVESKYFKPTPLGGPVCELNKKLNLGFSWHTYSEFRDQYEVRLVAQKNGLWWRQCVYALSTEDVLTRITEIENSLIKMFESI